MDVLGLFTVPGWLMWIVLIFVTIYLYYTWHFNDLRAVGIDGPKPYPVIGNMDIAMKHGMREVERVLSKKYGKVFTVFGGRMPSLVIADPKILRQIMIKDFSNFVNRQEFPLRGTLKQSIFDVRGARWKHIRTHLTPAFSTGKLKKMTAAIESCAQTMVKHLTKYADEGKAFEAKAVASSYSMDVIGRTIFSLQLDTEQEQNHIFVQKARKLFDAGLFSPMLFIMLFMPFTIPVMEHVFRIKSSMPSDVEDYFRDFITKLLEERKSNPQEYSDFVQMMLNSEDDLKTADEEVKADIGDLMGESTKKKGLTHEEIMSQCYLLLIGGYETVGSALSFALYHIVRDPRIEEKVLQEIHEVLGDKEQVSYEDIAKLTYLEMVVSEGLRLYPGFPAAYREAARDVEYEGVKIPKGTVVVYPIRMMQMDSEVYPDPEKFIPERFSAEEKAKRDPLYFAVFGAGQRNCIGTRVAMLEVKMALALTLRSLKVELVNPDQGPLVLAKLYFPQVEGGINLKASRR